MIRRFQVTNNYNPNECSNSTFVVDYIIPLCIRENDEQSFSILFLAQCNAYEDYKLYLSMYFSYDEVDKEFINNHALNINNILKNPQQREMYSELVKDMTNDNLYMTDFDMEGHPEKKILYIAYAFARDEQDICKTELLISRAKFVQLNLFFLRFINHDTSAETVFFDYTLNKVEYVTVDNIKLDASSKPAPGSPYVTNHYTAKISRALSYRFHFISAAVIGRRLRNPMPYEQYTALYKDDFLVDSMFMDAKTDTLFLIYVEKNKIDGKYKKTVVLKLSKEVYNHTNFLDIYKIYEDIKEK